jgi:hypothetical protein
VQYQYKVTIRGANTAAAQDASSKLYDALDLQKGVCASGTVQWCLTLSSDGSLPLPFPCPYYPFKSDLQCAQLPSSVGCTASTDASGNRVSNSQKPTGYILFSSGTIKREWPACGAARAAAERGGGAGPASLQPRPLGATCAGARTAGPAQPPE